MTSTISLCTIPALAQMGAPHPHAYFQLFPSFHHIDSKTPATENGSQTGIHMLINIRTVY